MLIRLARQADIPTLLEVYDRARQTMRARGNTTQWVGGYPSRELLEEDIARGFAYVVEEEGRVHAAFAFIVGPDPTYAVIEGAWPDQAPYGTLHRVASDGTLHGVLHQAVAFAQDRIDHLRADTHASNLAMQQALEKEGFVYCGIIHVADGTPRRAYARTGRY